MDHKSGQVFTWNILEPYREYDLSGGLRLHVDPRQSIPSKSRVKKFRCFSIQYMAQLVMLSDA